MQISRIALFSVFLLIFFISGLQAQTEVIQLNSALTGSATSVANKQIILKPGFSSAGKSFRAYIDPKAGLSTPEPNIPYVNPLLTTNSASYNYIFTREFNVPTTNGTVSYTSEVTEAVQYFDGLGRPIQTIQLHAAPNGSDVVQHTQYDNFGREADKYLQFVAEANNNGKFIASGAQKVIDFYSTGSGKDYATDSKPWAHTTFDHSPLNRAMAQEMPGSDWSGHTTGFDYSTNTVSIPYWKVDNVSETTYALPASYMRNDIAASQLYVTQSTDADNHASREYKDKESRVVLTENLLDGAWLQTFYVYNDFGLLACVIPPKAQATVTVDYCYFYFYDARKRLTRKKLPGAGEVIMLYDNRDRIVLTQDANLRTLNQWIFTKYDVLNRPVMTGKYYNTKTVSQLIDELNAISSYAVWRSGDVTDNITHGYNQNTTYPTLSDTDKIYTLTYYDDYTGITENTVSAVSGFTFSQSQQVKGLVTANKIRVLKTATSTLANQWISTINYYDNYARVIQTRTQNHKNGTDLVSYQLDFKGKVLPSQHSHTVNTVTTTQTSRFEYDASQRLKKQFHKINNQEEVLMSSMEYNLIGQLKTKRLHWSAQKLDYTYNIQGWLTSLNNPDDLGADLFAMNLRYNNPLANFGVLPSFTGNITSMKWTSKYPNLSQLTAGYGYSYDQLNRLLDSRYAQGSTLVLKNSYNETLTYDANGNILTLNRMHADSVIDNLSYTYTGNQVTRIADAGKTYYKGGFNCK